jgi:hypothetical protein
MIATRDSDRRHGDSDLGIIDSEVGQFDSDFQIFVGNLRNCVATCGVRDPAGSDWRGRAIDHHVQCFASKAYRLGLHRYALPYR